MARMLIRMLNSDVNSDGFINYHPVISDSEFDKKKLRINFANCFAFLTHIGKTQDRIKLKKKISLHLTTQKWIRPMKSDMDGLR